MNIIISRCAPAAFIVAFGFGGVAPASAADGTRAAAPSCTALSNVQQRIVEKADQGIVPLRHFVHMTKFIYDIDMFDVAESLDGWRAGASCAKRVAELAPKAN